MENISLIGFMGAGKTAVSQVLAHRLNRKRLSTDDLVIEKEKISIKEIFEKKGEAYFRQLEKEIVCAVTQRQGLIIDCGGGVALDSENMACLRRGGVVIYLKASVDEILRRTSGQQHRPLLNIEDPRAKVKELLFEREPFYLKSDTIINTDQKSVEDVSREILSILEQKFDFKL